MSAEESHARGDNKLVTQFRFTRSALRALAEQVKQLGLKQVECCDTEARGLRALVYATGRIVYHARYMLNKRSHHVRLFDFELGSVEDARAKSNAIRLQTQQGIDPKAPKIAEVTFEEFARVHFLPLGQGKKSHKDDVAKFRLRLNPAFGNKPLTSVTTAELSEFLHSLHTKNGVSPATANRYRSVLRAMFAYAAEAGYLTRNPALRLRLLRENNKRTQFMSANDMAAFMEAADHETNRPAALLLKLLALTGARLGEGLAARFSNIDLDRGEWHLPTSKSGKPGVIMLSESTKAIIRELAETNRGDLLFPGQRDNACMSRPIKAFQRICHAAHLQGFRIHDLRHGWASVAVNANVPLVTVSANLRHAAVTTTMRYTHTHADSLQAANDAVARLIQPGK